VRIDLEVSFTSQMANSWPGPSPGDAGSSAGTSGGDSDAGASGSSSGGITLSKGAIIAIIVCAVSVCILGGEVPLENSTGSRLIVAKPYLRCCGILRRNDRGRFVLAFESQHEESLLR
jgi:hypothetical protein